jgi:hypothetical protein
MFCRWPIRTVELIVHWISPVETRSSTGSLLAVASWSL